MSESRIARKPCRLQARPALIHTDLFVYHDMSDPTDSTGGSAPVVGERADKWFGALGRDRYVVALGPGVHEGRISVVLAHGARPMTEVQALLDRLPEA
jgi:hypothetical protein